MKIPGSRRQPLKGGGGRSHVKQNPIDLFLVMSNQKPWYQSKTLAGLLVLILNFAASKFEWIPEGDYSALVETVFELIGSLLVAWGRFTASKEIAPIFKAEPIDPNENL